MYDAHSINYRDNIPNLKGGTHSAVHYMGFEHARNCHLVSRHLQECWLQQVRQQVPEAIAQMFLSLKDHLVEEVLWSGYSDIGNSSSNSSGDRENNSKIWQFNGNNMNNQQGQRLHTWKYSRQVLVLKISGTL